MTLDALQLDVPDALQTDLIDQATLGGSLTAARRLSADAGLQEVIALLARLNRSAMTLLERQRALQNFSDEYRHYSTQAGLAAGAEQRLQLCAELAMGYKRLLLQILQGHKPSQPHLAWCLYMAEHFIAQSLLQHCQQYREPDTSLWRDSHLLYWLGEQHGCLDEPVAAAFIPTPADTLRGLYQQTLLLALSNPPHLHPDECQRLFAALAPLAALARLLPWDAEDKSEGPLIDLQGRQAYLTHQQRPPSGSDHLLRLELGALLVALGEPAPLRSAGCSSACIITGWVPTNVAIHALRNKVTAAWPSAYRPFMPSFWSSGRTARLGRFSISAQAAHACCARHRPPTACRSVNWCC